LIGPPTTFAAQHDGDTDADGNDSDPTNHGADDDARWVAPFDWIVAVRIVAVIVAVRIVAVWNVRMMRMMRVMRVMRVMRMMGVRRSVRVPPPKELTPFVMHI
jgi:hypothetical protein